MDDQNINPVNPPLNPLPDQGQPNVPTPPTVTPIDPTPVAAPVDPAPPADTGGNPLPPPVPDISFPSEDSGSLPLANEVPPSPDGTASPMPEEPPTSPSKPKLKLGKGKVIATILGILLLVGGVGAGIVLVQQQQDIREKAAESCKCDRSGNVTSNNCSGGRSPNCTYQPSGHIDDGGSYYSCGCITGGGGGGGGGGTTIPACGTGLACNLGGDININCWGGTSKCSVSGDSVQPYRCCCPTGQTLNQYGQCAGGGGGDGGGGGGTTCSPSGAKCDTTNCCQDPTQECKSYPNDPSLGKMCELKDCECDPTVDTKPKICTAANGLAGEQKCIAKGMSVTGHCGMWGVCKYEGAYPCSSLGEGATCKASCDANETKNVGAADCNSKGLVCCRPAGGGGGTTGGETVDCSQVKCTATSCTVGSAYNQASCWVSHYACDDVKQGQAGCNDKLLSAGQSASFTQDCGTEQIDIYCPACDRPSGSPLKEGTDYISKYYSLPCEGGGGTESTAQCVSIKTYDTDWNLLIPAQLSALSAGDVVRFAVSGSTNTGTIDKAQFTVSEIVGEVTENNLSGEITTKRPGTNEFYYEYTIPANVYSFKVSAKIHHSTLGWF
jgi:hypothetical protein